MRAIKLKCLCYLGLALLLSSCGSGGNQEKAGYSSLPSTIVTSSSDSNSSMGPGEISVDFIFPVFNSNLGGATKTAIKLKVNRLEANTPIVNVEVSGIALEENGGGQWQTAIGRYVEVTTGEQVLPVTIIDMLGNRTEVSSLKLVNNTQGDAGVGDRITATGLAFNQSNGELFFSDAYDRKIYRNDFYTSQREVIYQENYPQNSDALLFWQIVVNSENNNLFALSDSYTYDDISGSETIDIQFVEVDLMSGEANSSLLTYSNDANKITSSRSIFLDAKASLPTNFESLAGASSIYSLDYKNTPVLKRITLDGKVSTSINPAYLDYVSSIATQYEPLSMVRIGNSILVAKKYGNVTSILRPSLSEISFTRVDNDFDGELDDTNITGQQYASLQNENYLIQNPSAMSLSHDESTLYIADQDKIWAMDVTSDEKPFRLLTSSSIIPEKLGSGPRLGSSITSMAMHPLHDVLYVAAGAQGVIAIDIETGDRITVAK